MQQQPWLDRHPHRGALVLWLLLVAVYHANGDFLIGDDISPTLKTADGLATRGEWSFGPQHAPVLFHWEWRGPRGWEPARVRSMQAVLAGRTAEHWFEVGQLRVTDGLLTTIRSKVPGRWVTQYGPGGPLTALPAFLVAHAVTPGDRLTPDVVWRLGKLVASCCVAGAAVLIFLIGLRYIPAGQALLVALTFALGTCAWSNSSQTLWQHPTNEFWLALGLYALVRATECADRRWAALTGLALGMAVCCRPTSGLAVVVVGLYLLIAARALVLPYVVGGLPTAIGLGAYNYTFIGMPWTFGQTASAEIVARARTGSPEVFQTPLLEGAIGLLASPSRGLLVFSPVLIFAAWGAWRAWRRGPVWMRALPVIVLAAWIPASKHLGWWGGWSFGYRFVVDESMLLCLLLIPIMGDICRRRLLRALFSVLLAYSILVQLAGAVAYDTRGWNGRVGWEVQLPDGSRRILWDEASARQLVAAGARPLGVAERDIDRKEYYGRLWSWSDSQLIYLLRHFRRAREARRDEVKRWLEAWD